MSGTPGPWALLRAVLSPEAEAGPLIASYSSHWHSMEIARILGVVLAHR